MLSIYINQNFNLRICCDGWNVMPKENNSWKYNFKARIHEYTKVGLERVNFKNMLIIVLYVYMVIRYASAILLFFFNWTYICECYVVRCWSKNIQHDKTKVFKGIGLELQIVSTTLVYSIVDTIRGTYVFI